MGAEGLRAIVADIRPFLAVPPLHCLRRFLRSINCAPSSETFAGLLAFAIVSAQAAPIATRPMQAEIAATPSIESSGRAGAGTAAADTTVGATGIGAVAARIGDRQTLEASRP